MSRRIASRAIRWLASFGLACVLLVLLLLLTFLGTLEQAHSGLFEVQKKYFESFFLVHRVLGVVPIPLPGAYPVMVLLFVNLSLGFFLRIRKTWSRAGLLLAHCGILLLLFSGFVKHRFAMDGYMTLYEGEASDHFQSYYEWEVSVQDAAGGPDYVIPLKVRDLEPDAGPVTWRSGALPFDLELSHACRNGRAQPVQASAAQQGASDAPAADGFQLLALPPATEAERNVAGLYVTILDKDVAGDRPSAGTSTSGGATSGARRTGILWGMQRGPFTFASGGRTWACDLRPRRWQLPFTISLQRFEHELHPRTGIDRSFASEVTRLQNGASQRIRISMNEPLRHEGYTLYQASWGPSDARPGDPLFSTFAVARNPADRWPLYACIVIATGLVVHFCGKLARHLRAQSRRPAPQMAALVLALGIGASLAGDRALAGEDPSPAAPSAARWDRQTLRLAARLPIQDGGRIKPLETYAGFLLLGCNGRRSCRDLEGRRLGTMEWFLDCLFEPERASAYPIFLVQTHEVLDAIDLPRTGKAKRARYSLQELAPGRQRLHELADRYAQIDAKQRSYVQSQIIDLAHDFHRVELLIHALDFARFPVPAAGVAELLGDVPAGGATVPLHVVLDRVSTLLQGRGGAAGGTPQAVFAGLPPGQMTALAGVARYAATATAGSAPLAILPPSAAAASVPEWLSPDDIVSATFSGETNLHEQVQLLGHIESLVPLRGDPPAFLREWAALDAGVTSMARARGEAGKLGLEVDFQRARIFDWSLAFYLLAFVLVALSWLRPSHRLLLRAGDALTYAATAGLVTGIVVRCILRARPPVTTLYETILFITAVAVCASLVTERVNRQGIARALAVVLGASGMLLANRYEAMEGVDTMPSLVAVLDTNFWLSTHVTTVTMGYSAGLLASAFAHVYVLGRLFGWRRDDRRSYASLSRTVYGVVCFGLIFSIVGTILGGVWANESWGRFWGWDPKENGALMIVLWELFIVHARLGGYLRELGVALAAIFGGLIVAFSWWGVNLLGIGLHSYGFTSGVMRSLMVFYIIEVLVLSCGALVYLRGRTRAQAPV